LESSFASQAAREPLRRRLYRQLNPSAFPGGGVSPTNAVLGALIILAVAAAVAETEPMLTAGRESLFRAFELAIAAVFAAEYCARLWTCVEDPRLSDRAWPRLRFALSPSALIDLAAILPVIAAMSSGGSLVLRTLRLLRILRIAKLGRVSRAWGHLAEAMRERRAELGLTAALAGIAILFAATLLYWAEADAQPDKFGSIPRALWWAVVTITTIGYGDAIPVTPLGKLFSGLIAIFGVMLIALPTGILAAAFSDVLQRGRAGLAAQRPAPASEGDAGAAPRL
jgi:voltage-gated potassium channel